MVTTGEYSLLILLLTTRQGQTSGFLLTGMGQIDRINTAAFKHRASP